MQCFDGGLDFLDRNRAAKDWLLHHRDLRSARAVLCARSLPRDRSHSYRRRFSTGRRTRASTEAPAIRGIARQLFRALVALCDHELGRLLDIIDEHDLWDDTALIVSTDHGFLLGEHDWWAKNRMPCYNEVAHIPLFFHHPALAARPARAPPPPRRRPTWCRRSATYSVRPIPRRAQAIAARHGPLGDPAARGVMFGVSEAPSTSPTAATPTSVIRTT